MGRGNNIPDHLADQLARALAYKIDIATTSVTTNFSVPRKINMPGKYNVYDENDLPKELRKWMEKDEEVPQEIMLPRKEVEQKHLNDQIDLLRKQMEYERKKHEQNDPVARELRDLRNEVEHLKDAMRKIGVLLDTDLPDGEAFDEFKMLRDAFKKYKMVEKLVLGDKDDR